MSGSPFYLIIHEQKGKKMTAISRKDSLVANALNILFGIFIFSIGIINISWGNDPEFGVFILLISAIYFPPISTLLKTKTGLIIPWWLKVFLALFVLWAALGVGELFDKIKLMMADLT